MPNQNHTTMKNTIHVSLILLLTLITISLSAQSAKTANTGVDKRRAVAAKLLVEIDKTPKATNNNNNGRSNKDNCCDDGIVAPTDYQVLAFGLSSQWYIFDQTAGDVSIPNPIPYLQGISTSWDAVLYNSNTDYISNKAAYVQDNELLLGIEDLAVGSYFIEILHGGDYYVTGFSIGNPNSPKPKPMAPVSVRTNPSRVLGKAQVQKHQVIAAQLLGELDNKARANNRNNGRSNKDECCSDEIAAPAGNQVLSFGIGSQWYLFDPVTGDQEIPNPIPYLQSIASVWDAALYTGDVDYLSNKAAYVQDNELLIDITGLPKGKYFIEVLHNDDYYTTGFRIGNSRVPQSTSVLQKN